MAKKQVIAIKLEILDAKGKVVARMASKPDKDKIEEKEGRAVQEGRGVTGGGTRATTRTAGPLRVKPVIIPADAGVQRVVWNPS